MSMVTLGNAVWNVVADSTGLQQGLDQSRQSIEKTGGFFARNSRKIGLAVSAAGAAITGVMAKATSDFATGAHEIGMLQEHTGFAAESLGQMVRVFENAGLGAADLRRASYNVRREIASMKDATDESTTSLGQLGLSYEELNKLSPEQQFLAVVDAMEGVDDANTRASLANDIFRGKAEQMLLVMGDTEGAFRAAAEAQRALYTQEDIDNAAAYDDVTNDLNNSLSDLWATLGRELLPEIIRLKEWITTVVEDVRDWVEENPQLTSTIIRVASVIGGLMAALGPLIIALPGLKVAFAGIGTVLAILKAPLLLIGGLVAGLGYIIYKNWDTIVDATQRMWDTVKPALKELWEAVENLVFTVARALLPEFSGEWSQVWDLVGKGIEHAARFVANYAVVIIDAVTRIVNAVTWVIDKLSAFKDFLGTIGEYAGETVGSLLTGQMPQYDGIGRQLQTAPNTGGAMPQGQGTTINFHQDNRGAYIRDEADMDRMARDIGDYTAAQLAGAGA